MGQNCSCFEKDFDFSNEKNIHYLIKSNSYFKEKESHFTFNNQSIKIKQIKRNSSLLISEENNIDEIYFVPKLNNTEILNNKEKEDEKEKENKIKISSLKIDQKKINILIKNISGYISRKNFF